MLDKVEDGIAVSFFRSMIKGSINIKTIINYLVIACMVRYIACHDFQPAEPPMKGVALFLQVEVEGSASAELNA